MKTEQTIYPDRRFIATITLTNGETFTTVIYGPNVSAAEKNYIDRNHNAGALRAVVRDELR